MNDPHSSEDSFLLFENYLCFMSWVDSKKTTKKEINLVNSPLFLEF